MPTYKKRSGISGIVQEHGASVHSTTEAVATKKILTEAKLTFSDASGYVVGEKVTETDSGIIGYIYWIKNNVLGIVWASGEFVGSKIITGETSSTAKTPTSVLNILNRTADTPIHTPLLHSPHDITSTGVGDDQTLYLDEKTKWLMVWKVKDGNVTVCNFSSTYPMIPILIGGYHSFRVEAKIAKIVLQFDAAGTCQVLESEEELP
jgi:hypothetical protein